jgi:hypothetical protein
VAVSVGTGITVCITEGFIIGVTSGVAADSSITVGTWVDMVLTIPETLVGVGATVNNVVGSEPFSELHPTINVMTKTKK